MLRTHADQQAIWDYVSEPNNDPKWVNTTPLVDVVGNGPDMEFTFQQVFGKKESWGTAKVVEWDEPRRLVWRVEDSRRVTMVTYEIADGWFRQTNRTKWKQWRLLSPLMYPFVAMQMHKQLRALGLQLREHAPPPE